MRPTLPTRLFDLCLIPEHDLESLLSRIDRCRVIPTRGVLNPFQPSTVADPSKALLLIGGPSRHHGWSNDGVLRQLQEVIQFSAPAIHWTMTTSRRTPESFLRHLEEMVSPISQQRNVDVVPYAQTEGEWLAERLEESASVFVTEDSVSMMYEALTVGADVGVIDVPRRQPDSRNARCVDRMVTARLIIPFSEWRQTRFETRQRETFNEASRCAEIVCEQLLDAA